MDKSQARQLIRETFESPFDKDRFKVFVKNLLNTVEDAPFIYRGKYIPDAYDQYVSTLERIGRYIQGETRMDILMVTLKKTTSLERARTMQRNFIAWYLNGSRGGEQKDAALVAFVSPDQDDWRFSLVKMDYRFEKSGSGNIKVREEFTPARRWSFLVGASEKSHTAQSRFVPLLANVEYSPALAELEQAFNIETVTREFFLEYRKLFFQVTKELNSALADNPRAKEDFQEKNLDTVNFAKKLLGQIVFLYFLQKKGWFGVARDAEWGRGSRHFLRELFEKKYVDYSNFFNDVLEPLFYDALSIDRSHIGHYNSRFNCRIPFLNGGLFDPMNGYDWVNADLFLPNSLFSNTNATRQGDTGDGILDVFDRFNFTVKEDEPLEREVAIDPELLGKAYEKFNAIRSDNFDEFEKALKSGKKGEENRFNRQFGVFYTPRQFVHYMCRQALIRHLATELSGEVPGKDLETLVRMGEGISANEAMVMKHARETRSYSHKLPQSVREHAEAIDACLAGITVCDPAVGSGAFPVGMMIEIVRTRSVLSIFMENKNSRSSYDFKRHCIEYGLFGVDIDPGAVEIAKLRLWLSLIVDEDDPRYIKPLPNLDFKFVQGDFLQRIRSKEQMLHLLNEVNLEEAKEKYFNEADPRRKNEYREMINELLHQMTKGYTLFDFRIYFSEVFRHKGGFDVMIGNPPYIQLQKDGGRLARLYSGYDYKTFQRTGDIYTLFYENGIRMLKPGGHLCFITSSKWMKSEYGQRLRKLFLSYNPILLIELGPGVFESATVDTNILLIQKDKNRHCLEGITLVKEARENSLDDFINAYKTFIPSPGEKVWFIGSQTQLNLREKIEGLGKPLKEWEVNIIRGVLTGYNKAFIVDPATRDRLVAEDPNSAAILRPVLRGRDIERYTYNWAGLWLIASGYDLDLPGQYPAVFAHLKQFEASARKRHDQGVNWWNLRACAYYSEFEQEKVVWIELADKGRFAYVEPGVYTEATTFLMTLSRPKYFVGCLNSRLINWYFSSICASSGMGTNRWKKIYVELLPVPPITPKNMETVDKIETLVDRIIDLKKDSQDTSHLESRIDHLVYRLYGLTSEEIGVVEG